LHSPEKITTFAYPKKSEPHYPETALRKAGK